MSHDIHVDQVRQPLLIIAKTQVCPDTILSQLPRSIPNVVRFDGKRGDPTLIENAVPSVSDTNYGQHQQLERQLDENQRKLNALLLARFKAFEHDPVLISTAIPTDYLYHMNQPNHSCTFNFVSLWSTWAGEDPKIRNFSNTQEDREEFCHAQSLLENNYLKDAGRDIMQTLDTNDMKNRFNGIGSNPVSILPIADSFNWPFEISARTSEELRTELEMYGNLFLLIVFGMLLIKKKHKLSNHLQIYWQLVLTMKLMLSFKIESKLQRSLMII